MAWYVSTLRSATRDACKLAILVVTYLIKNPKHTANGIEMSGKDAQQKCH